MSITKAANFINCLKVDYEVARINPEEVEVRLKTAIVEIPEDKNYFYKPIPGDRGVRHFKLEIYAEERYLSEEESAEDREWHEVTDTNLRLPFYMSTYGKPSLDKFVEHIYRECFAAVFAIYKPDKWRTRFQWCDRKEIHLDDVFVYLKLLHKNYEDTRAFVRDYWYWHDCLYQTHKWFHYLMGDIGEGSRKESWLRWDYPIGERIFDFISVEDYPEEVNRIRAAFK